MEICTGSPQDAQHMATSSTGIYSCAESEEEEEGEGVELILQQFCDDDIVDRTESVQT